MGLKRPRIGRGRSKSCSSVMPGGAKKCCPLLTGRNEIPMRGSGAPDELHQVPSRKKQQHKGIPVVEIKYEMLTHEEEGDSNSNND